MSMAMAVKRGAVRLKTTVLLTSEEIDAAVKKTVGYRCARKIGLSSLRYFATDLDLAVAYPSYSCGAALL